MGRYTGEQTASSTNPNVAKISYAEAVGLPAVEEQHQREGGAGGVASAAAAGKNNAADDLGGLPARLAQAGKKSSGRRLIVPHVENTGSSNSGAGSSNFHTYRRERNAELERVEHMELAHAEELADAEFKKRRRESNEVCDMQTRKRAAKRARRKQNQRKARRNRGKTAGGNNGATEEEYEKGDGDESGRRTLGGSGRARIAGVGHNALPNNGTALARLLSLQQKK